MVDAVTGVVQIFTPDGRGRQLVPRCTRHIRLGGWALDVEGSNGKIGYGRACVAFLSGRAVSLHIATATAWRARRVQVTPDARSGRQPHVPLR